MSLTINNESFTITNNGKSFEILKDNASLDRNSERVYMNGFWWDLEKATADGYASLDDLYNTLRDKIDHRYASGGGGGIESIVEGTNITVDDTDPLNPIVSVQDITLSGEVTGSTSLSAIDKTAITNKTTETIVGTDYVLFGDTSDGDNLKKGLVSDIVALSGGGGTPAGSDTQIQYNNAGAFGASSDFTRSETGVTNISSTFGDETLQYQITDNLLGSGKNAIASTFTVPLGSLTDFTSSDGGIISSQKTLEYPSVSAGTYSQFSYNGYRATVIVGTNQGNLDITSGESSLTKITDLDGINEYKTGFRTAGGSAIIGDIDGGNNTKITIDDVNEQITISNLPAYDDDTAAGVGGLTAGMVYMTTGSGSAPLNAAGILMIKQ